MTLLFVVGTVATLVYSAVRGDIGGRTVFNVLIAAVLVWYTVRQRKRLLRAIELNDDGAP